MIDELINEPVPDAFSILAIKYSTLLAENLRLSQGHYKIINLLAEPGNASKEAIIGICKKAISGVGIMPDQKKAP